MTPTSSVAVPLIRDLEPAESVAFEVAAGTVLRLSQVEGGQVADLVSFARDDLGERLSMFRSRSVNRSWRLTAPHVLVSTRGRLLWTILDDDVRENYTGGGYCNPRVNQRRYGTPGDMTCEGNLAAVLAGYGLDRHGFDPDTCFNIFMCVDYAADGTWTIRETPARSDQAIVMRAEADQLVGLSNCPQLLSDVSGRALKRLRLELSDTAADDG